MWLFTTSGFYSVVKKGRMWHIRAQQREHLERFGEPIVENLSSDYRYRILVNNARWRAIAAQLASEVDYDNFKGRCRAIDHAKLFQVWRTMQR